MCRVVQIALLALMTAGCMSTFHQQPYITYADTQRPLADTAVFSTAGLVGNTMGQIVSVDGVETSCWKVGCPFWVRVIPGIHVFKIRFSVYDNGIASYKQGEGEFEVTSMKARHVYEAQFSHDGQRFHMVPKDLGENPNYGATLGLKGYNQQYFPVRFE